MAFCSEFAEEKSRPPRPAPKRAFTLEDRVSAMDWDLAGALMDVRSLKRSRWWHRLALVVITVGIVWIR